MFPVGIPGTFDIVRPSGRRRIDRENAHAENVGPFRDLQADAAEAENPNRFPADFSDGQIGPAFPDFLLLAQSRHMQRSCKGKNEGKELAQGRIHFSAIGK